MMRELVFTERSSSEAMAFLAVSHPRARALSCWADLPENVLRQIIKMVLQPICREFWRWDPMSLVKEEGHAVFFGVGLQRPQMFYRGSQGIAVCGAPLLPDSGLYTVEFEASKLFSQDGFCRADIGVIINTSEKHRLASGIWWEAGDGDVYVADDAGGVNGSGLGGWLGDESRVENGVLPRWDDTKSSIIGMVFDTHRCRLGFTKDGNLLPFETSVPFNRLPLHFAVDWDLGAAGEIRIKAWRRFVEETSGLIGALLAELRPSLLKRSESRCATTIENYCRRHGLPQAELVAAVLNMPDLDSLPACRRAIAKAFSKAHGGFSTPFAASVTAAVKLRSGKERAACDLAAHASDPETFEQVVLAQLPKLSDSVRKDIDSQLKRAARTSCMQILRQRCVFVNHIWWKSMVLPACFVLMLSVVVGKVKLPVNM